MGFRTLAAQEIATDIETTTDYHQLERFLYGLAKKTEAKGPSGNLLKRVTTTWATKTFGGGSRAFPYPSQSIEESFDLASGTPVTTVTTTQAFDDYGNPTQIAVSTSDGHTKTTVNTYTNDTSKWHLGRLTRAEVTASAPGATTEKRVSTFAYAPVSGLLSQETIEPGTGPWQTTDYQRDTRGNKIAATVSGPDIGEPRMTLSTYDSAGRFPLTTANALGHTETRVHDPGLGAVTSLTGPNVLTTSWQYDTLGRKTGESRPDTTSTTWTYGLCGTGQCASRAFYFVRADTTGAPAVITQSDSLGREVQSETYGFDGRVIVAIKEYDSFGRLNRASRNHFAGDTPQWSSFDYDALNRVTKETDPDGSVATTVYEGLGGSPFSPTSRLRCRPRAASATARTRSPRWWTRADRPSERSTRTTLLYKLRVTLGRSVRSASIQRTEEYTSISAVGTRGPLSSDSMKSELKSDRRTTAILRVISDGRTSMRTLMSKRLTWLVSFVFSVPAAAFGPPGDYLNPSWVGRDGVVYSECARADGKAVLIFPLDDAAPLLIELRDGRVGNLASISIEKGKAQIEETHGGIYSDERVSNLVTELLTYPFRFSTPRNVRNVLSSRPDRACVDRPPVMK